MEDIKKAVPERCAMCGAEESEENDIFLAPFLDGDLMCGVCEDRMGPYNYWRAVSDVFDRLYDEYRDRQFDDHDRDEKDW